MSSQSGQLKKEDTVMKGQINHSGMSDRVEREGGCGGKEERERSCISRHFIEKAVWFCCGSDNQSTTLVQK
jgi:hypothetical protein